MKGKEYCDRCGKKLSRKERKYLHHEDVDYNLNVLVHECHKCWRKTEKKRLEELFSMFHYSCYAWVSKKIQKI